MKVKRQERRGTVAAEFAVVLTFIIMPLCMITVDFARLFYHYTIITNCARNGALWASDPLSNLDPSIWNIKPVDSESPYANITQAVLADASSLSSAPRVNSTDPTFSTDGSGNMLVSVTVTYDFHMLSPFLFGYETFPISRTETMRVLPKAPN
jgi:Flp pilus assembly protein TadG